MLTKDEEEAWVSHQLFGHINFKAMHLMSKNHMAHGMPSINQLKELCSGCLMSKKKTHDHTHMICVYMLKTKDEALSCFKKFKLLVKM